MSKINNSSIAQRYFWIAFALVIVFIMIIGKAFYTMTAKKQYWIEVASRLKSDSITVKPNRGNILSCDGQLMASSIPEYKIYMDFGIDNEDQDSLWNDKVDSVCTGLSKIFPERSAAEFKRHLEEGHNKKARHWPIWPKRITYNTYTEVKALPFFSLSKNASGFHEEEFNARRRPFGSLGERTIGSMYGAKDSARLGLELAYDTILRGTPGLNKRRKVLNAQLNIPVTLPIDGCDIVTTIDVNMQDLAERALVAELKKDNCDLGVAILMEVTTGDIKAIVNMERCPGDVFRETKNFAVADLREPGSVFKTASVMVALDDGVADTAQHIETAGGIWPMHGAQMKDHNWRKGGYGYISLGRAMEVSSNIGISRVIDENYGNRPEKYVEGIYRTGLAADLKLPIQGYARPHIRMPKKNKRGQWLNWSKTALPWMSIGYETQLPPISTLTFYNAIANDGVMMRPRFVKYIMKEGKVVEEYPPTKVMEKRMAKMKTVKIVQSLLERVVSKGTGKKAGSRMFHVAGKTGTAQVAQGGGYKTGGIAYWLSFAGYFPAEKPRYSCIVCIKRSGYGGSGGMSADVFHQISEGVMARNLKLGINDAHDENSIVIPDVKRGDMGAAGYVLSHLGIKTSENWSGSYADGNPIWGSAERHSNKVALHKHDVGKGIVPDVVGMGAKDAVYLLESTGMKVKLQGRGHVKRQSCQAGQKLQKGTVCTLILE